MLGEANAGHQWGPLGWRKESVSFCKGVQGLKESWSQSPWSLQSSSPATVPGHEVLLETKGLGGRKLLCVRSSPGKGGFLSIPTRFDETPASRFCLSRKETAQDVSPAPSVL